MTSLLLFLSIWSSAPEPTYRRDAAVEMITFDLNSTTHRMDLVVADGFPGTDESFSSMVKRTGAIAAINGAYFDKFSKKPIGDVFVDGNLLSRGSMGTVFALKENGTAEMFRVQRHKSMDWTGYRFVLGCGPALVLGGKKDVRFEAEGFRDPSVTGSTSRMGVGILPNNRIVFAYVKKRVTFDGFAEIMLKLGCRDAMNLDGGASLAMVFNGKSIRSAGRKLTNVLVIRPNPSRQ